MLLGTLIAFTGLNQHSEVVAMKAAGISAHQILAPLIVASLGIAVGLFAFNERVVVNAARDGHTPGATTIIKPVPPESGILSNVWVLDGDDLVASGSMSAGPARDFHAERRDHLRARQGRFASGSIDAARAEPVGGAWRLRRSASTIADEHGPAHAGD